MAEVPEFRWKPLELQRPLLFKSGRFHLCAILVGHLGYIFGGYQNYAPSLHFKLNSATVINFKKNKWEEKPVSGWTPEIDEGFSMHLVRDGVLTLFPCSGNSCLLFLLDLPMLAWRRVEIKLEGSRIEIDQYHAADYWEEEEMILVNTAKASPTQTDSTTYAVYLFAGEIKKIRSKGVVPTAKRFQSSLLLSAQKKWYVFGGNSFPSGLFVCDFTVMRSPVWTELASLNCRGVVRCVTMLPYKDKLFVLGGTRPYSENVNESKVFTYDTKRNTWQKKDQSHLGAGPSFLVIEFHKCFIATKQTIYVMPSGPRLKNQYFKLELVDR